jgi:hypothetical protein
VDLKKAFDTVNRGVLIYKLSCLGFKANFLNIMKNIYREVNYCVKLEEGITDKFSSKVGVKQGCILLTTLFSLYINDLIQSLDIEACDSPALDNEFIPCLLYADYIVLLSESAEGLQHSVVK